MISGPVTAMTPEGVRGHLRRNGDCLESGLALLRDGIEAGGKTIADGIARDARGDAALILLALDDTHPASRVLALRDFLRRSGRALGRALSDLGLKFDDRSRILVIGSRMSEQWIADLAALSLPELEAWDLETFLIGGQHRLVVQPVLGVDACGGEDNLSVPAGVRDRALRQVCAEWLGVVRRLDPSIAATGDRFSRTFTFAGQQLARLVITGDEALVAVPGFEAVSVRAGESADLVLRRYLALFVELAPEGVEGARETAGEPEARLPRDTDDLAALARGAAASRVSAEEYEALGRSDRGRDFTPSHPPPGSGGGHGSA